MASSATAGSSTAQQKDSIEIVNEYIERMSIIPSRTTKKTGAQYRSCA